VTNDDGVDSPGIKVLAVALAQVGHDVTVFAPMDDRSGAGAAIGRLHGGTPPSVRRCDWSDAPGIPVHALDAPPATAVMAACLGAFGEKPELVVSGINPGQNTGHLVLHSGTVGAALTAAGLDVPGLAVSLQYSLEGEYLWETAATFAVDAIEWVALPDEGAPRVLNLNAPNVPINEVKGVREAVLAAHGEVWIASADVSSGDLKLEFKGPGEAAPGTDVALVRGGYVAVTQLVGISGKTRQGAPSAAEAIEAPRAWARMMPEHSEAYG